MNSGPVNFAGSNTARSHRVIHDMHAEALRVEKAGTSSCGATHGISFSSRRYRTKGKQLKADLLVMCEAGAIRGERVDVAG